MADFVFNIARGRVAELVRRVDGNDPADCGLTIIAIDATGAVVNDMKDADNLNALLLVTNVDEANNTGYVRKDLSDTDVASTDYAPDDANDYTDVGETLADITWSSVANDGIGAWSGLIICYNPAITTDVDTNIIPLTHHDFAVTPNGGDITAQISNTLGFYRAYSL